MKTLANCLQTEIEAYLAKIGMTLVVVADESKVPGSFWGESEAGLIDHQLFARSDTPFHSILHESGHYICMTEERRNSLHTNAIGNTIGNYTEEDAVCYLQALLADSFSFYSQQELFSDMDEWGYNFRLGSAQAWFLKDAGDACSWLKNKKVINQENSYTYSLRE